MLLSVLFELLRVLGTLIISGERPVLFASRSEYDGERTNLPTSGDLTVCLSSSCCNEFLLSLEADFIWLGVVTLCGDS